jgi:sortase A
MLDAELEEVVMAKVRSVARGIVGLLGELLLTVGIFLLAFVGWQLWWTDVVADQDSAQVIAELEANVDTPADEWTTPKETKFGKAFAIVRIPRFGAKYARPLYEGKDRATLRRGIGHYPETAMPGEIGNFSMAGHRTTYGKPFNKIAELQPGDRVIIETRDTFYIYKVSSDEIVRPTQVSVAFPVPNEPGVEPTEAMLTMTSCHPMFSSRYRYVIHGILETEYPRAGGLPPEMLEVRK